MIEYSDGAGVCTQDLKALWKKAFGDEDGFINTFFESGYSQGCCRVAVQNGRLSGMLFWFDCHLSTEKIAYIYGVATDPAAEGQGVATGLLEDVHRLLKDCGYSGAILVPGSERLFYFYEKRGYRVVSTVSEGQAHASGSVAIEKIDVGTYAQLRKEMMPVHGLEQIGRNLDFLDQLADCYRGDGFIAAISKEDQSHCMEYLGEANKIPQLAGALGCDTIRYRMPGQDREFAMGIGFDNRTGNEEVYFGLAFD